MQALTNKAQQVDRRPMNLLERMYLPAIVKGMAITFSHIFKKKPKIAILGLNPHNYSIRNKSEENSIIIIRMQAIFADNFHNNFYKLYKDKDYFYG